MGPSANENIIKRVRLQLQKLYTCPASLARELQRADTGSFDISGAQVKDDLKLGSATCHYELQHQAHQAAAVNASKEQQALQQQAGTAWLRNLLVGSYKQFGMQELHEHELVGDMEDNLCHLLRYTAHWLYLHILQHAWCPDQGPYQSALVCTEPLFQLLPPHQQLQLVGEVLGGLCQEQEEAQLPDTLLHTAALLSLVRLAGELVQAEAAPPSADLQQGKARHLHALLARLQQPSNQGLAVAGRMLGRFMSGSGLPKKMVILPSVMPSTASLAAAAAAMMQQLAAAQVALASVFGPQPSPSTRAAWGQLQDALHTTSSALGHGCVPAQGPGGTGATAAVPTAGASTSNAAAAAAAAAAPAMGDLAGMQHVQQLVEAISVWQPVKPGGSATPAALSSSSSSSTTHPKPAKASPEHLSSSADTVDKLLGGLVPCLRQAMRGWEMAVVASAFGDIAAGASQPAAAAPGAVPADPDHTQQVGSSSSSSSSSGGGGGGGGGMGSADHPLVVLLRMLLAAVVARTQLQGNKLQLTASHVEPAGQHLLLAAQAPLAAAQQVVEAAERLLTTRLAAIRMDVQQQEAEPAQQAAAARRQQLLQLRRAEAALASAQGRLGGALESFLTQVASEEHSFAQQRLDGLVNAMAALPVADMLAPGYGGLGLGQWTKEQTGVVSDSGAMFSQQQCFTLEGLCQALGCSLPPLNVAEVLQSLLTPGNQQLALPGWPVQLADGAALGQQQQQQQPWGTRDVQALVGLQQWAALTTLDLAIRQQEHQALAAVGHKLQQEQDDLALLQQSVAAATSALPRAGSAGQSQVPQVSPEPGGGAQVVPPGGCVSLPLASVRDAAPSGDGQSLQPQLQQQQQQQQQVQAQQQPRSPGMQRGFFKAAAGASPAAARFQQQLDPGSTAACHSSNGAAPLLAPLALSARVTVGGRSAASPSPTAPDSSSSSIMATPGGQPLPPGLQLQARRPPPGFDQDPSSTQNPTAAASVQLPQRQQHTQQLLQQLRPLKPLQLGALGGGPHSAFQPVASSSQAALSASQEPVQDWPLDPIMQMRGGAPSEGTLSSHGSSRGGSWCGSDPGSPLYSSSSSIADWQEQQQQQQQQGEQEASPGLCLRLRGGVPSEASSTASSRRTPAPQAGAGASSSLGSLSQQPWPVTDACLQAWAANAACSMLDWPPAIKQQAYQVWQQVTAGHMEQALATAGQAPAAAQDKEEQEQQEVDLIMVLERLLLLVAPSLLCQPLLTPEQWQALVDWWSGLGAGEHLHVLNEVRKLQQRPQGRPADPHSDHAEDPSTSAGLVRLVWTYMVNRKAPQLGRLPPSQRQLLLPPNMPRPAEDMPGATVTARAFLTELGRQLAVVNQAKVLLALALGPTLSPGSQQAAAGGCQPVPSGQGASDALPPPWPQQLQEWAAHVVLCATLLQNCILLLLDAVLRHLQEEEQDEQGQRIAFDRTVQQGRARVLSWCATHCPAVPQYRQHTAGWLGPWQEVMGPFISVVVKVAVPQGPAISFLGAPLWMHGAMRQAAEVWAMTDDLHAELALCKQQDQEELADCVLDERMLEAELLVAVAEHQEQLGMAVTISDWEEFLYLLAEAEVEEEQGLARTGEDLGQTLLRRMREYKEEWQDEWEDTSTEPAASDDEDWRQRQQHWQQGGSSRLAAELALADALPAAVSEQLKGVRSTTPGGRRRLVAPRGHSGSAGLLQQQVQQLEEMVQAKQQEHARLLHQMKRSEDEAASVRQELLARLLQLPAPTDHQHGVDAPGLGVLVQALTGAPLALPGTSSAAGLVQGTIAGSSSSSGSRRRVAAPAPAVTCGPEHQDWQQLVNWVQKYGFDSQAAPVVGEALHAQVAAVVRVYASEVGHLRRLMEPLAGRAARRLGQLLEAKQRHMHWLKLGPAPAADAPSPISMLLPDGRSLPSQDWSPLLQQQYTYLRRLSAALQQRSKEVDAIVVAMTRYQPKPGDCEKGKRAPLDKAIRKEEMEAILAWGSGLRTLYWGARAAAAPRFWGELRARQRRLKGKLSALQQLQAAWAALAPGSAAPPPEQQRDCSQALAAGEALAQLQQQLLDGMQGVLKDVGPLLSQLVVRGFQWQSDMLVETKIEANLLRDPLRRTANEARMQQVLYLARHRGVALPRGISDQQLAAACRRVNERTLLKVPQLFTSSLHPWRWLACRPHAAAYLAPLGTFARAPSYASYTQPSSSGSSGSHQGGRARYSKRRPLSPCSSHHSAGSGASRGGTRRVFRRHTGRHFPQDAWAVASFTDTSRGESVGDADGSSEASSSVWAPAMQGARAPPLNQPQRRHQRGLLRDLVVQQHGQVQGEAYAMYQRAKQVLLVASGVATAAATAAAAAPGCQSQVEGGGAPGSAGRQAAEQGRQQSDPLAGSKWLALGRALPPGTSTVTLLDGGPPHAWVRPAVESFAGVTLVTPQMHPAWDRDAIMQSIQDPRRTTQLRKLQQEVPEEVCAVVAAVRNLAQFMPALVPDPSPQAAAVMTARIAGHKVLREAVMDSTECGSASRELLWNTLIEQKPEAQVFYVQWAIQLVAARRGDSPRLQLLRGMFDKWRTAAAGDRLKPLPQQLDTLVMACTHPPLWQCMAGSVLCDLLLVPAAWRDLLGPGVGGGGRLTSDALRLPPQLKAAPAPNTAAAAKPVPTAQVVAGAGGSADSSRSHGGTTGAAAAAPPAATPSDAQQASLLLAQVARAARSSYSATYSPRALLLSLLRVLVLAPEDKLMPDIAALVEKGGAGSFSAAAVAAQAATDWGLVDGHHALLHTSWQRAAPGNGEPASATTSDDGNSTPATSSGSRSSSSSSSSEDDFAGLLSLLNLLLLHNSPLRAAVGHRAWLQLLACWGHALRTYPPKRKEDQAADDNDSMVTAALQQLHRLLPLVVGQLQDADVAELLQLLLGVCAGREEQPRSRANSSCSVGAPAAPAAAAPAAAAGLAPAGWWQQYGAWQWRPQSAGHPQGHRQQQTQQAPSSSSSSSSSPAAVVSCWEACDWCQGQVPCSSSDCSGDDDKGAQDQQQQKPGSGCGAAAAGGTWGCPHCGMARYCSAGCAAAAKKLHSTNCWRLAAMARPDPAMTAWRLSSAPKGPMFTFLQQPGSQHATAAMA